MHLGFSLTPFGHHPAAWRQAPETANLGFDALLSQVVEAEAAGFDFVLLADRLGARPSDDLSPVATPFEPTMLASALATRARKIGFLAAAATYQHEPYNLARRFASLDSISHGRVGWVAIGKAGEETRDGEYIDLVSALWDSWEDDAFIYDKAQGRFFVPDKMHVLNHQGAHFSVRGPLNVNRSPQGKPVIAAVLTAEIKASAAQHAELVLLQESTPQRANDSAAAFARAIEAEGRRREDIRILANLVPVLGASAEEARAASEALRFEEAHRAIQPLSASRLVGTAHDIAEAMQQWLGAGAIDGFTILPPTLAMAHRFFAEVVPELRHRGLIADQAGETLRDRLGLARPAHPAAKREQRA